MAKKLFCGVFILLLFSSNIFAENIYGSEMEYLKNVRNDEEMVAAAETWERVISYMNPIRVHRLSKDLYNAINRQLSRWEPLSVGDMFIFSCSSGAGGGYDVVIGVNRVNRDGSCNDYSWIAWRTD